MAASMPWVKVYTEILDDPKILRLSLSAKWRFIQLIALAGEADASGAIVNGGMALTLADLSARLRDTKKRIQSDINELDVLGLISSRDGVFFVENFEKRQGRPQSERQKMWRDAQNARRIRESKTAPEPKTSAIDPVVIADTENVIDDSSMTPRPRVRVREDKEEDKKEYIAPKNAKPAKPIAPSGAPAIESPKMESAPPEKPTTPKPRDEMFDKLASMTSSDPKLQGGLIARTKKQLGQVDASFADLCAFEGYWSACDWRGQKGQAPSLPQIVSEWKKFTIWREKGSPGPAQPARPALRYIGQVEPNTLTQEQADARYRAAVAADPNYEEMPF